MANETMKYRRTSSDVQVGTAGTGVTVVEKASGVFHVTEITLAGLSIAITGGAQSTGALIYTMPPGDVVLINSALNLSIVGTTAHVADTPEFGLGTVLASGTQVTLGATVTTWEDLWGPYVLAGMAADGTEGILGVSGGSGTTAVQSYGKVWKTADTARGINLNTADTFATGVGSITITGKIWLTWIAL